MSWNFGKVSQSKVLKALNLTVFPHTIHALLRKDNLGIQTGTHASMTKQKLKLK